MNGDLKVLEVNNTAYRKVKNELNKYKNHCFYMHWICAVFTVGIICLSIMYMDVREQNKQNVALMVEMENKVSILEKDRDYYTILLSEKDDTIKSLESINEYVNSKIANMQSHINELNEYIDINVIKLEATPHLDLTTNTEMDTKTMNQIIDYFGESNNTRFKGHGSAFIEASKHTGLNPVFILSLSCLESGYGTSKIAKDKNNFMGIGAYDNSPYNSSYILGDDIDAGIINGAIWIKENYYNQGQTTLHSMIYGYKMYSSSKDHWIDSICNLMNTSYTIATKQ